MSVVIVFLHGFPAKFTFDARLTAVLVLLLLTLQSWKQSRCLVLFARSQAIELLELDSRIDRD